MLSKVKEVVLLFICFASSDPEIPGIQISINPISNEYLPLKTILNASKADAQTTGFIFHSNNISVRTILLSVLSSTTKTLFPDNKAQSLFILASKNSCFLYLTVTVKVEPFPNSLSNVIFPPNNLVNFLHIAKPIQYHWSNYYWQLVRML